MPAGSTTSLPPSSHAVPRIEIESLDMIPFSESFSGLFENENDDDDESDDQEKTGNDDEQETNKNEMSYYVEQYSDVKDLDPEWNDDDIAEIMVLSPKQQRYSTLPTISEEHDILSLASSNEAHCSQLLPQEDPAVTLADFDIMPTSEYPMLCRKRSSNKVYVIKALSPGWYTEKSVMESVRALCAPFLEHLERYFQVDGLSSLHAANLVHRDLTPFNIFIDHTGHVVLSNFGNAILISADTQGAMPPSAAMEYQPPKFYWVGRTTLRSIAGRSALCCISCWSARSVYTPTFCS
ncbi:AGC/AKT protein kinase [Mycena venus]|uniref:AGC/AKT protein kinase n=1 Tax=Mycena venus TaxID=2733690 RepID=A0A8H6YJN1_9AGAR|nr:AGC/AKT protein kinase [Mycena venus]